MKTIVKTKSLLILGGLIAILSLGACNTINTSNISYEVTADGRDSDLAKIDQALRGLNYERKSGDNPIVYANFYDVTTVYFDEELNHWLLYIRDKEEEAEVKAALDRALSTSLNMSSESQCRRIVTQTIELGSSASSQSGQDKIQLRRNIRDFLVNKGYDSAYGVHSNDYYVGTIGDKCRLMNHVYLTQSGGKVRVNYKVFGLNDAVIPEYEAERDELVQFFRSRYRSLNILY